MTTAACALAAAAAFCAFELDAVSCRTSEPSTNSTVNSGSLPTMPRTWSSTAELAAIAASASIDRVVVSTSTSAVASYIGVESSDNTSATPAASNAGRSTRPPRRRSAPRREPALTDDIVEVGSVGRLTPFIGGTSVGH